MKIGVNFTMTIIGSLIIAGALVWYFLIRKRATKLFVIGNGFDLYHGIPSSYLRFRDYVKENDADVYRALQKYLYLDGCKF